ncbi:hypothetical protein JKP88DRAFT_272414 [Tribonema minus]|uniref:Ankyrin repeat domain-containing protein n=1 Tax=Tribonema minus TaxID=303371 RepID=A0A835ZJ91_9STRA|nr:hypothetical protein JKP88DRAFT_272414 [Tribonema minus]
MALVATPPAAQDACPVAERCDIGLTPLHAAAAYGDAATVRALLNMGVDANPTTMGGVTPLQSAVATGGADCACAALLRKAGGVMATAADTRPARYDLFEGLAPPPPRRAMDDNARELGRRVPYYGQY